MNIKYTIGAILTIPFLPVMYFQGKKIKSSVPELPEAKGNEGKWIFEKPSDKTMKVLAIGESTVAGIGVETHEEGFAGTLGKELSRLFQTNVDWKVYARSGYSAKRVTEEILPTITESDIDIIVVGIGANDAFELNSLKRWRRDVTQLITVLRTKFPEALIVFCNMPPIKEFPAFPALMKATVGNLIEILGEELNELIKPLDRVYYNGEVITLKGWSEKLGIEGTASDFFSDGVHPSKLAYQVWAKDIAFVIRNEEETKKTLLEWV